MSVTILLIPTLIAAITAASAAGATGAVIASKSVGRDSGTPGSMQVATRMKDRTLLADALGDLQATDVVTNEHEVTAVLGDLRLTMTRGEEGIWEAHFESLSGRELVEADVEGLITSLDKAYAGRVQTAVAERIRLRAGDAGLDLVSEHVEADETVTMVLNVRQGA